MYGEVEPTFFGDGATFAVAEGVARLSPIAPIAISAMHAIWIGASDCRKASAPIRVIATIPTPDQIAYATPTGMRVTANAISQKHSE